MKILTALIAFDDGDGKIYKADAIEKDGKLWLVPRWLGKTPGSKQIPVRLFCISNLPHQMATGSAFGDIILKTPIPRDVYEGRAQPTKESGLLVIETDIPMGDNHTKN